MRHAESTIKALEGAPEGSLELERMVVETLETAAGEACTRSLDVALTLLPPAGYWELMSITNDGYTQFACEVHSDNNRPPVIGVGKTAALAVCAAALKARQDASATGAA